MSEYPKKVLLAYAGRRLSQTNGILHAFYEVTVEKPEQGNQSVSKIMGEMQAYAHPLTKKRKKFTIGGVYEVNKPDANHVQLGGAEWRSFWQERTSLNEWRAKDEAVEAKLDRDKEEKDADNEWLHKLDDIREMWGKTNRLGRTRLLAKVIEYITHGGI